MSLSITSLLQNVVIFQFYNLQLIILQTGCIMHNTLFKATFHKKLEKMSSVGPKIFVPPLLPGCNVQQESHQDLDGGRKGFQLQNGHYNSFIFIFNMAYTIRT